MSMWNTLLGTVAGEISDMTHSMSNNTLNPLKY